MQMSETKFVHARGEKSHLKENDFVSHTKHANE